MVSVYSPAGGQLQPVLTCFLFSQIPENPPDYQKYYRHMNKVQWLELAYKGCMHRAEIWAEGME